MEYNTPILALLDQVCQTLAAERRVTTEQSVGNDTHGPHVHRLAVSALQHHLGSGIAEGASHGCELLVGGVEHLRDTEISEHKGRILGGCNVEKILRLEVYAVVRTRARNFHNIARTPVDNVVLVKVVDSIEDLADGLGGVLLRESALLANAVEQLSSRSELGDDVVFVLAGVRNN